MTPAFNHHSTLWFHWLDCFNCSVQINTSNTHITFTSNPLSEKPGTVLNKVKEVSTQEPLAHGLCSENVLYTLTSRAQMVLNIEPMFAITFLARTSSTEKKTEMWPQHVNPPAPSFHDQLGWAGHGGLDGRTFSSPPGERSLGSTVTDTLSELLWPTESVTVSWKT